MKKAKCCIISSLFFTFTILSVLGYSAPAFAETIDELKQKIEEKNTTIKDLEQEINHYKVEVDVVGKEAKTLKNTLQALDLTEKKINTDIRVAENKINVTTYTIEKINLEITATEESIEKSLASLAETLRSVNENDDLNLLEVILTHSNLSEFWNDIENIEKIQKGLKENMALLRDLKSQLEEKKGEHNGKKKELVGFKENLDDKKKIVVVSKNEKNNLLKTTQNKESSYKKILEEKVALKKAFEKELLSFESELKIAIDPQSYAKAQKGVLAWPLDSIKITQYFGNTAFARAGGYNGKGHNGVDFAAPLGTPIKSAQSGIIVGTGDTDLVCPDASYGKWILVQHTNGLSTLYGHLSLIKAVTGKIVSLNEVIGYSGNSGYSTGPHLHFTVFATQGVKIMEKKSAVCGGTYVMPIADLKAYLDPLLYL